MSAELSRLLSVYLMIREEAYLAPFKSRWWWIAVDAMEDHWWRARANEH
jgi:hypothetical protein